jgi:hypothetical protein
VYSFAEREATMKWKIGVLLSDANNDKAYAFKLSLKLKRVHRYQKAYFRIKI